MQTKTKRVKMKVTNTDAFLDAHGIKCLITGSSGVGKTRSVLSLKEAGYKPLLISAESGVLSLRGSPIPMIDIAKTDDGKEIPMAQRISKLYEIFTWLKSGQKDYNVIFLDSLTEVNQTLMAALKEKHKDMKDTLKLYMDNSEIMLKLVREFRDLPYHVVIVSLSEVEKDDVGRRFTTASVVGKVAQHLPSLMDEVLNLQTYEDESKKPAQRFQCRAHTDVVCKDRSGKLNFYEQNDLGKIFLKIENKQPIQGEKK